MCRHSRISIRLECVTGWLHSLSPYIDLSSHHHVLSNLSAPFNRSRLHVSKARRNVKLMIYLQLLL
jgi:hypothetical protein